MGLDETESRAKAILRRMMNLRDELTDMRAALTEVRTDVKWIKDGMEKHQAHHDWWWKLCIGSVLSSLAAIAVSVFK